MPTVEEIRRYIKKRITDLSEYRENPYIDKDVKTLVRYRTVEQELELLLTWIGEEDDREEGEPG